MRADSEDAATLLTLKSAKPMIWTMGEIFGCALIRVAVVFANQPSAGGDELSQGGSKCH